MPAGKRRVPEPTKLLHRVKNCELHMHGDDRLEREGHQDSRPPPVSREGSYCQGVGGGRDLQHEAADVDMVVVKKDSHSVRFFRRSEVQVGLACRSAMCGRGSMRPFACLWWSVVLGFPQISPDVRAEVRAMCVRVARFRACDVRSHFCTLFGTYILRKPQNIQKINHHFSYFIDLVIFKEFHIF